LNAISLSVVGLLLQKYFGFFNCKYMFSGIQNEELENILSTYFIQRLIKSSDRRRLLFHTVCVAAESKQSFSLCTKGDLKQSITTPLINCVSNLQVISTLFVWRQRLSRALIGSCRTLI